ncbi:FAD binding oxidoreductase [Talaromyces proteolyticus]|uniref:FAD binding oxidoreductase n=1 Tax=Talaromyces proteolyticus TaxID=1131652 RepID=A0AAD4KHX1_9EURO|nr:FAD binding oxidoreductase [Talaromyces proteolyticus]KAH8689825.1 FAD binding oxidoreductase [Talaromyces proteolyticus]
MGRECLAETYPLSFPCKLCPNGCRPTLKIPNMPHLSYSGAVQLKRELRETNAQVITPDDENYAESITRFSESSEREAGAIVRVTSTSEVSKVINFATKRYIPVVVQGGGFSTSGSSSTYGGIVISLSKMSKVVVDPASRTLAAQAGATWADVDNVAASSGLAVVGCTVNHTSVGGTALGGGYGWLTGRHGLIIDNLLSIKMVLADGRIVNASTTENTDLFWAARGAGQSFGAATELVFKAHRQPNLVFGGYLYYTTDKLPKIVEFANRFEQLSTGNEGLFFGFNAPINMEATMIFVRPFYNGPRLEAEKFFQPILSLGPIVNETSMMPYPQINTVMNRAAEFGGRKRFSGTNITLPLQVEFMEELYRDFDKIIKTYRRVNETVVVFELIPYTEIIKVPSDATAFANRGKYYNVGSIFCWYTPELDKKMGSLQNDMMHKIGERAGASLGEKLGDGVGLYANYAGISPTSVD